MQKQALPVTAESRDLVGYPTGPGKTAAFLLPIIRRIFDEATATGADLSQPLAIVLTPDQEFATQVRMGLQGGLPDDGELGLEGQLSKS